MTSIAAVTPNPRNTPVSTIAVTFSIPVNSSSFGASALTLTDNSNPVTITSAVSLALVSGSTYDINGLAGLSTAEGTYSLTVNAAGISDAYGNPGTGSLSTSWLMDTTPPTSTVSALPAQTTSTSFNVSATSSDPTGSGGSTPSGVASIALYDSKDGGPYTEFATVTPATPSASFTGQAGHTYGFYSIATDNAGNVQPTPTAARQTVQIISPLSVTSIAAVSPNPRNTSVSSIDVTFSMPINLNTFTDSSVTLTDNGGVNVVTSAVSFASVTGSTYQINGLSGLTKSNGNYTLTVNAAAIQDTYGNPGSGTASTSWLMDTNPTARSARSPARHEPHLHRLRHRHRGLTPLPHHDIRHLLHHQPRSLVALDLRPGLQPLGHLHRPEQHDLRLLQHRPRPGRQHRSQNADHRGQHLPARPDPAGHRG